MTSGLGLNITYDIVAQKHQGEIDVQSRSGRTVFARFNFPFKRQHEQLCFHDPAVRVEY